MIRLPYIAAIPTALLLSLGTAAAQGALPSQPATCDASAPANAGTEAVPGQLPGTRRYNVTFRTRAWGLEELRQAIDSKVSAASYDALVSDRETRATRDYEPFCRAIEELGGRVVIQFWLINACTVEIRPADVARVRAMPNVLEVQPDLAVFPDAFAVEPWQPGPSIRTSTNAANHNSDYVHQTLGLKGTGFSIAYIDTGQDSNMAAIGRPHMTYFRNGSITATDGGGIGGSLLLANVAIGAASADDTNGNGTGRCGIAAGSGWNSPNAGFGHAFDAGKVGYSICNSAGGCGTTFSIEAAGWQQAAADKVRYNIAVAGMGYSGSSSMTDVSQMAIDSCALVADILPCTPASSSISGSSATANGLAVARALPNVKTIGASSARGPMGVRTFPDIAANGENLVMPTRDNESADRVNWGAEAQVVGVALLVKAARPASDAREIKALLLASSEDVAGYTPNTAGQGYLRADWACDAAIAEKVRSGTLASTTTPDVYRIAVTSVQPVKLALTWFRHVVTTTAYSDLKVVVKNGTTVVASSDSVANLYEVVTFNAPITGILTVEVSAASLEIPSLPYALASTHRFIGGTPGTYATAGTGTGTGGGCAGTSASGIPALGVTGRPILGKSFSVDLTFAPPSTFAILFLGSSNTSWNAIPLPLDLGSLGAPGCFLRVSGDLLGAIATSATGTGKLAFTIPNTAGLLGVTFWNQLLVNDRSANSLGFTTSNSGSGRIGDL